MCAHTVCMEFSSAQAQQVVNGGMASSVVLHTNPAEVDVASILVLRHLVPCVQVRPVLRNAGVNVLGTPSRKESLLLTLPDLRSKLPGGATLTAAQVAPLIVGARAYINWPYLQE